MLLKKIFCIILLIFSLSLPISNTHSASLVDTTEMAADVSGNDLQSVMDYIELIASQLSCEIGGVASALTREGMSYTCITPISQIDMMLNTLISPTWPGAAFRLKINYDKIPSLKTPDGLGQCHVNNRANFDNPTINFAFCSNLLLYQKRALYTVKMIADVVAALLTGSGFKEALLDNLIIPPVEFHANGYNPLESGSQTNAGVGKSGTFFDVSTNPLSSPVVPWKVVRRQDTIAVATSTFGVWVPVGSKLIKEPYPISKYDQIASTGCQTITECFNDLDSKSKTFMNFSGKLVECTRQMLVRALIDANLCNNLTGQSVGSSDSNLFHTFQINMTKTVQWLLTLYIIFFGFNILLTGGQIKKSEIIMFVIKFLLVTYFSIGINSNGLHYDGIMTYLVPLMLYGGNELASIVMSASTDTMSGLCHYTSSDYPSGYEHMAMWDSLDCRIWNYLGLQGFFNFFNASGGANFIDAMYTPIPFYILLLGPCIYFGWIQFALVLIAYPLFVIGLAIYTVQAYIICMICIILLSVLAPIFVPMALFEYTKGYFQSWCKLILSFGLQPLIVATFLTLMFNMFDVTFNHTCKFHTQNAGNKKIFLMDTNPSSYATEEDFLNCTRSLGFIFTPGGFTAQVTGGTSMTQSVVSKGGLTNLDKYKESFPFLSLITEFKGMFTKGHQLSLKGTVSGIKGSISNLNQFVWHLMFEMMCCVIMMAIMKNMADQLSDFAADMTEGISVGAVTMSPNKLNDLKNKAADLYKKAKSKKSDEKEDTEGHEANAGEGQGHGANAGESGGHAASSGDSTDHSAKAGDSKDQSDAGDKGDKT